MNRCGVMSHRKGNPTALSPCKFVGALSVGKMRFTREEFVKRAKEIHGDKYDYSKVVYVNATTPVKIICPVHGVFSQKPYRHINENRGCKYCSFEKIEGRHPATITKQEFIDKAKKVHGDKYDYSNVKIERKSDYIDIYCPTHGFFTQLASEHLRGRGCRLCGYEKTGLMLRHTTDWFINEAIKIHGDKYDYSNTKYTTKRIAVEIICKEHGSFWQLPHQHLVGNGCPICGGSAGENRVLAWLINNKIEYIRQYAINNDYPFCLNKKIKVDFYLPDFNTIIEYNGKQHYEDGWFFKEKGFERQQNRDMALKKYCKEHKIRLIEIPYKNMGNIEDILTKELKIHKNKV